MNPSATNENIKVAVTTIIIIDLKGFCEKCDNVQTVESLMCFVLNNLSVNGEIGVLLKQNNICLKFS